MILRHGVYYHFVKACSNHNWKWCIHRSLKRFLIKEIQKHTSGTMQLHNSIIWCKGLGNLITDCGAVQYYNCVFMIMYYIFWTGQFQHQNIFYRLWIHPKDTWGKYTNLGSCLYPFLILIISNIMWLKQFLDLTVCIQGS